MAWIESHQSLLLHRKTIRASMQLHVDRHKLIGHLHALWWWGLDNAEKSGCLGETMNAEIAEAAGWAPKKADQFVQVLIDVRFLDRVNGDELAFHNWPRYTNRYYDQKDKTEDASSSGAYGNHIRWHVNRHEVADDCPFCIAPTSGAIDEQIRGANRGESLPTDRPNQPTEPTNQPDRTDRPTEQSAAAGDERVWALQMRWVEHFGQLSQRDEAEFRDFARLTPDEWFDEAIEETDRKAEQYPWPYCRSILVRCIETQQSPRGRRSRKAPTGSARDQFLQRYREAGGV